MKTLEMKGELRDQVVAALGKTPLFGSLEGSQMEAVVNAAAMVQFDAGESVISQGDAADSFFLLLRGETKVMVGHSGDMMIGIGRLLPPATLGDVGLLLDETRTASVVAVAEVTALQFDRKAFQAMFDRIPGFGISTCRGIARRLEQVSYKVPIPSFEMEGLPSRDALSKLPLGFMQRQRVLPLKIDGNDLTLGFVDDPTTQVAAGVQHYLPGLTVHPVRIDADLFNRAVSTVAGVEDWRTAPAAPAAAGVSRSKSPRLDSLLERMTAEGASDLHLSAGHNPRWRIDGQLKQIEDAGVLGADEVLGLVQPVLEARHVEQFEQTMDVDFGYSSPGGRVRGNMFRDRHGVSAVLRNVNIQLMSFEELGLPQKAMQSMCDSYKGLILVTGATGSGKSTTLAAMIDHINGSRQSHIITMEDPIEFVHESKASLVNQREIGSHAAGFGTALRASLREDPDVILVGELRDPATLEIALELANTGHLVLATMHTNSAVLTIDRIIDVFPGDKQNQIRTTLADVLIGVIAQVLCRKTGGGRVAAVEIMMANSAVSNLIREDKLNQIPNAMQVGRAEGMRLMNDELARLVKRRQISKEEALTHSLDRKDLEKRIAAPPADGAS